MKTESDQIASSIARASISIHYCRQCNWMLRSSWLCQELLHTFSEEI
ncbi:Rdx family protein, partial [Vibrio sp. 10N.222.55.E8]